VAAALAHGILLRSPRHCDIQIFFYHDTIAKARFSRGEDRPPLHHRPTVPNRHRREVTLAIQSVTLHGFIIPLVIEPGGRPAGPSVSVPIPEHVMDGTQLSLFPSYSWFGFTYAISPSSVPTELHLRQVNHLAVLFLRGSTSNQWIRRDGETHFNAVQGMVGLFSADEQEHVVASRTDTSATAFILAIPPAHLQAVAVSEGLTPSRELLARPSFHDAIMRESLARLVTSELAGGIAHSLAIEVAARSLVLRIMEIMNLGTPDWRSDSSTFDSRTMSHITDHIDAHLQHFVCLADLGRLCSMSPSHFAKKFRQSTGVSLQRFVNRRRLQASMALLQDESKPLSQIALDMGFSSQSHFTRLFSELTGFTPASFRRQIGRA
jgi:AraC-like DNA-binding protein